MPTEGRLGFLSKSGRGVPIYTNSPVGPGDYVQQSDYDNRPNFAPFCTTTKRELVPPNSFTPSPGAYDIAQTFENPAKKGGGSMFKSKSRRFVPPKPSLGPGPGTYALKPAIEVAKPLSRARSHPAGIFERVGELRSHPSAPSIPTKFQSFGYEEMDDGLLKPQEPLKPGFSGVKDDRVGPGDYEPKILTKAPVANFQKGAARTVGEKPSSNPGPGHYNYRSSFEAINDTGNIDGNFYLKLNEARVRQLSSFASTSQRAELGKKIDPNEPGPGTYNVPRDGLKIRKTRPKTQCFDSTSNRFQDPMPRSQRTMTNPGTYNPLTSDFEKNRLNILRKKRMGARSGWAQNVSFQTTEERFFNAAPETAAPPPGTYKPKTALADSLPKENPRAGPFGSSLKSQDKGGIVSGNDANDAFVAYQGSGNGGNVASRPSAEPIKRRVVPSRSFASNEERFEMKKDINHTPAPGTYDVNPKWGHTPGVIKMVERGNHSIIERRDTRPGPGDYDLTTASRHMKNPKSAMGGTGNRFPTRHVEQAPGPGDYNPTLVQNRTFNVIMADEEAMRRI